MLPMNYWFEHESFEAPERRQERLRRIAHESQEQEEGQVQRWLDLAKKLFDSDDETTRSAA